MQGWRIFSVDANSVLTETPLRHYYGEPETGAVVRYSTVECVARCEVKVEHRSPHWYCNCGLYFVDRFAEASGCCSLCMYPVAGPRVYAQVESGSLVLPDLYLYRRLGYLVAFLWPHQSLRAAELRITELWVPGPDHCAACAPRTPKLSDEILAALSERYAVPVRRLAPHGGTAVPSPDLT